ncbi:thioredoxin family protein [Paenibacillus silviterrae]|uniref:thioredoxin family protein n=1 Tax=Paenibacillus silviterrae TaxID=3242194 RepID=UPI002543613B|nr:thioredoxin domain-containing protein [Paenibacillus chinjuensis]
MSLKQANDSNFTELTGSGITLVDFGAAWCPPCKVLLPILEELEHELSEASGLSVLSLDVEESPVTSSAFGVMSMPTVILFKDGQPMDKLVGLRSKEAYVNMVQKHLA